MHLESDSRWFVSAVACFLVWSWSSTGRKQVPIRRYDLERTTNTQLIPSTTSDTRQARDPFEYYQRLGRVRDYVFANIQEPITLKLAARIACCEPAYFSKYFKQRTGIHFTRWLNERRIERARELLTTRNEAIAVVARKVGFLSTRSFERWFKRIDGLTPRQAKKQCQQHLTSQKNQIVSQT